MSSAATAILQDIVSTLRAAAPSASISLGAAPAGAEVPRLAVVLEQVESFNPDDSADGRWHRLIARVIVRTRCENQPDGLARAAELCESAAESLFTDPGRSGLCSDLPIGRATEVGRTESSTTVRHPDYEMGFIIRCHFESEGQ
ncbi:MAG: hypothetical protein HZA50_04475 [Planctomycetes bacterium]|nr:hypothetical protein [Planctomycetota bacterium]